jgi:hypothetical protein
MPEKIHTELTAEGGLLSADLLSLLGDAWRKRGKWREEWRCRKSGDGFANVYRGIRREKPRSLIRVQMLYCGKLWIDVPDTPGGEVRFIEENVTDERHSAAKENL